MSGAPGGRALLVAVAAVVVAAVIAGLLVLGSPLDERGRKLDETRVSELQDLHNAIDGLYRREGALPASLGDLARRWPLSLRTTEPAGGRPYGYEVIDSASYRLCTTFNFSTPENEQSRYSYSKEWAHRAGRQCFRFRVRRLKAEEAPRPDDAAGPILEGSSDSTP